MGKKIDLTGNQFGRLFVVSQNVDKSPYGIYWDCQCSCGKTHTVLGASLRQGLTKSCGCLKKERFFVHGKNESKEYHAWEGMIGRCTNKKNLRYYQYGGRGVTVCNRWLKFENFYQDMGDCPVGHSLDRIDNNMGYEPLNCRWATPEQQQRNTTAKGYGKSRGKFLPKIQVGNKVITFRRCQTEDEARNVYLAAKKVYHDLGDMRPQLVRKLHDIWDKYGTECMRTN